MIAIASKALVDGPLGISLGSVVAEVLLHGEELAALLEERLFLSCISESPSGHLESLVGFLNIFDEIAVLILFLLGHVIRWVHVHVIH